MVSFSSVAAAQSVVETEPNDSIATAQNIDAFFALNPDSDVANSTTIPHATVIGLPGNGSFDYFSFTVGAGSTGLFDLDYIYDQGNVDSYLRLYNFAGLLLAENDDDHAGDSSIPLYESGTGTVYGGHILDSAIQYTFGTAGTYVIEVGNCCVGPQSGGQGYELQVSLTNHSINSAVPEPATWAMMLLGFGGMGVALRRGRKLTTVAQTA
jgi:serralysin